MSSITKRFTISNLERYKTDLRDDDREITEINRNVNALIDLLDRSIVGSKSNAAETALQSYLASTYDLDEACVYIDREIQALENEVRREEAAAQKAAAEMKSASAAKLAGAVSQMNNFIK